MNYIITISLVVITTLLPACTYQGAQSLSEKSKMTQIKFPEEIIIKEMFDESVRMEPAENYPTPIYYFRKGERVNDENEADEIIPVVEVHIFSLDVNGDLIEPSKAKTMKIIEYGPEEVFLQSTTATVGNSK